MTSHELSQNTGADEDSLGLHIESHSEPRRPESLTWIPIGYPLIVMPLNTYSSIDCCSLSFCIFFANIQREVYCFIVTYPQIVIFSYSLLCPPLFFSCWPLYPCRVLIFYFQNTQVLVPFFNPPLFLLSSLSPLSIFLSHTHMHAHVHLNLHSKCEGKHASFSDYGSFCLS